MSKYIHTHTHYKKLFRKCVVADDAPPGQGEFHHSLWVRVFGFNFHFKYNINMQNVKKKPVARQST